MLLIPYAMNPFSCATQMPKSAPGRLPLLEAVLLRQAPVGIPGYRRQYPGVSMSHHHESFASHGGLDRRLWASAALNAAITLAEFVGGILSGSLALLSDAAHNLSDVVAIVLALMARRLGRRPPTTRHTYGLKRVEVVAALVNAVTLIAVTVLIAHQAVLRLLHPEPVAQGIMLVVALGALGANVGSALLLRQHDKGDVNVRGAFLHMAQDAVASLTVVVAALLARAGVGPYVDSVAALLVGLVVLRSALSLAWQTLSTILEGVPGDVDIVGPGGSCASGLRPGLPCTTYTSGSWDPPSAYSRPTSPSPRT